MFETLKRLLIGKPLRNDALSGEKYSVAMGLPILSSDAISSVAYATEEILLVLYPVVGILAYNSMIGVSAAIVGLLVLLTFSYKQTIQNYPNGGGAYIVAKENLGLIPGISAGAALSVDYILTVAVSISAGTSAIISAFPSLERHRVLICLLILLLIMLGNLRGITESAKIFSIPPYAFILGMVTMILVGIVKFKVTGIVPPPPSNAAIATQSSVTIILLLRAFSSGCSALTGVEAVSNAVPNFREPSTKHAQITLMLLAFIVLIVFGGISVLASIYKVAPVAGKTVLSQIAMGVFGQGFMYYYIQVTTAVILAMAANTAYSGFPMLISVISHEGYAPRQFALRGDRLSYSNGIIALSTVAAILIVVFKGETHLLIPLYAVGVFVSFTLSQTGMFMRWVRTKEPGWVHKAIINGMGALVTGVAVIIIGATKFTHGAWIVIVIIPTLVKAMLKVKDHYNAVAKQLRIEEDELATIDLDKELYRNRVIVPIASVNRASIRALRYAKTISDHVTAFNITINEEEKEKIEKKWAILNTDIPLVVRNSPYRKIVNPLIEFIESEEYDMKKGDMITVVIPNFTVRNMWHKLLHNHTRMFISGELLKHKHIAIATVPLKLKDDNIILKDKK
ncbi:APC family permease [Clostridium omnivorum]|uniref:Amino acid permease n=1 Tax=Clostridium omnivorum TaxID=1604902 RepID=A0ABQ5N663_9CLOT|nr:APC family permease [Clostridium sp. E14]GLC30734.1 amino acid permease [Clostridium sp. E14]